MWLTLWKTMRSHVGGCRVWETRVGKSWGAQIRLAGPTFLKGGGTINPIILIYNCYICILLIKTKLMICVIYFVREEWKYVSSLSATMSTTASTSWETMMSHCRTLPRVGQRGKDRKSHGRRSDQSRTSRELGYCRLQERLSINKPESQR